MEALSAAERARRIRKMSYDLKSAQMRVTVLEATIKRLETKHETELKAAYFAAWNECSQHMTRAAFAARNDMTPDDVFKAMGEHQ
jgi:methylphosphotriester-DNA--protein-cysteine methyltransferase